MEKNHSASSPFDGAHPSRLAMARFLAAPAEASKEFHDHVRGCADCDRAFSQARERAAAFQAAYPDWDSLARTRRVRAVPTAGKTRFAFLEKWFRFAPRAALAGLAVAAGAWYWTVNHAPSQDLTPKGEARFYLFVNGAQAARDTVECRSSDTLQLGLTSPGPMHYAVLYRDDEDGIRVYMENGRPLGRPKGENLPHSLILQGEWKTEKLYCVWSPRPFTAAEARARIGGGADRIAGPLRLQTYLLNNGRL